MDSQIENIAETTNENVLESTVKPNKVLNKPKLNILPQINQSMTIMEIVEVLSPREWENVFKDATNELKDIDEDLQIQEKIFGNSNKIPAYFPLKKDLFRAFILTPLKSVKVVLVGQDPYPTAAGNIPIARGLSFSVSKETKLPSSLRNMFTELNRTGFRTNGHGDLTCWAIQGVLLLNTSLTVKPQEPGSHGKLWYGFIYKVVQAICNHNPNCVFVLLGKKAQEFQKLLGDRAKTVCAGHPSGLNRFDPFVGSDTFIKVNQMLESSKQTPIDWSVL